LPRDVVVIEVEAADDTWGEGFTPPVETAMPRVIEAIRDAARPAPYRHRSRRPDGDALGE